MNDKNFINLGKRMVVQYYNKYVVSSEDSFIKTDSVHLQNFMKIKTDYGSNKIRAISMVVTNDPYTTYNIMYDPNNKKNPILSFIKPKENEYEQKIR